MGRVYLVLRLDEDLGDPFHRCGNEDGKTFHIYCLLVLTHIPRYLGRISISRYSGRVSTRPQLQTGAVARSKGSLVCVAHLELAYVDRGLRTSGSSGSSRPLRRMRPGPIASPVNTDKDCAVEKSIPNSIRIKREMNQVPIPVCAIWSSREMKYRVPGVESMRLHSLRAMWPEHLMVWTRDSRPCSCACLLEGIIGM